MTERRIATGACLPSKTTIVLEPLLGLKPGERTVVMCADAESAERIERHHLVAMARENGVVVETMTPEDRQEGFRGAAKTATTLCEVRADVRAREVPGIWIVDENTDIPPSVFETAMPSFTGSFMALPRRDGSVVLRGPFAREQDAPDLPIWRRNDPAASSSRA